jgi:hypothetical protein
MSRKQRYIPMDKRIQSIAETLEIQSESAVDDPYMIGLYNGLELALATLEQREPVFRRTDGFFTYVYKELKNRFKMKFFN